MLLRWADLRRSYRPATEKCSWVRFAKLIFMASLGSFRQNASRPLRFSAVIARPRVRPSAGPRTGSCGRSSNRETVSTGCPAFAAHDRPVVWRVRRVSSRQTSSLRGSGRPAASGGSPPPVRGVAKRRSALVRIPAPGGRLAVGPVPSAEGNRRPHDAGRHAFRRLTAAISLDPETAFWEQTGAADRRNALDSAGFLPRSSAPTSRVAPTDPCSWAGQCLPRPPEARLARPNPQAPHPAPFACVS